MIHGVELVVAPLVLNTPVHSLQKTYRIYLNYKFPFGLFVWHLGYYIDSCFLLSMVIHEKYLAYFLVFPSATVLLNDWPSFPGIWVSLACLS